MSLEHCFCRRHHHSRSGETADHRSREGIVDKRNRISGPLKFLRNKVAADLSVAPHIEPVSAISPIYGLSVCFSRRATREIWSGERAAAAIPSCELWPVSSLPAAQRFIDKPRPRRLHAIFTCTILKIRPTRTLGVLPRHRIDHARITACNAPRDCAPLLEVQSHRRQRQYPRPLSAGRPAWQKSMHRWSRGTDCCLYGTPDPQVSPALGKIIGIPVAQLKWRAAVGLVNATFVS